MNLYLVTKTLHLFFIIAWMVGLFYLPRLFVYHTTVAKDSEAATLLSVMEGRLFYLIMMPSMVLSLASGLILAMIPGIIDWSSGWIHIKFTCVGVLVAFHFLLNRWRIALKSGESSYSTTFFRVINEVPTLILLIILFCVITKPF
jgi:putative membrane protein